MSSADENRFPILSLSSIPSECIVKQLSCIDVFLFSTISKDCYEMMKDGLRSTPNRRSLIIDVRGDKLQLKLKTDSSNPNSRTLEWHFNGAWNRRRRWNVKLHTETPSKPLVFREKSKGRYVTASDSAEEVIQLAEHIGNLFRAFTECISISTENCRFLPAIQRVSVLQQAKRMYIGDGIVSHDTMLQVLTGFKPESLSIKCDVEPNFQLQLNGPILTETLNLFKGSWFTAPLFHTFNGNYLFLKNCVLTNADLNAFLLNWKTKTSHHTKYQRLWLNQVCNRGVGFNQKQWDDQKWDLAKITDGLEDIRDVSPFSIWMGNDMYKRQTDGMTLSIEFKTVRFKTTVTITFYYSSI